VMDAPTIHVSADSSEGNVRDATDIGLDVDHPVPVVTDAFPAVTIVTILASHGEAIRGIHEYVQGVPIEEEMSTLRIRMGMAEAKNASLCSNIRTIEAIETITRCHERRTRMEMERQLASVMDVPTIHVSADSSKGNVKDATDIGLDVDHPVPVVTDAFPAVTIVTILASHGEAIRGIHEYVQGVPIEEEMSTLRFRMGMAEAENASLCSNIRTIEAIETITRCQERRTRMEMERQLASV
nr:hypothetical protein [Tanacetum cinerariifolium]